MSRLRFWWRYLRNKTPWDTGITPPEVVAVSGRLKPGRALDLGCGTGTSSLYLAAHGWQVVGIDFAPTAIRRAKRKAARAGLDENRVTFHVGDVTRLNWLTGLFDLAVDVGCFHGLNEQRQTAYVLELARLLRPDALVAIYASCPRPLDGRTMGITPEEVAARFTPHFTVESQVLSKDTNAGFDAAWYELKRTWPPMFG